MEKESRRQINGWTVLAVAVIYLPLIHLAGKLIDKKSDKQKTRENGKGN